MYKKYRLTDRIKYLLANIESDVKQIKDAIAEFQKEESGGSEQKESDYTTHLQAYILKDDAFNEWVNDKSK